MKKAILISLFVLLIASGCTLKKTVLKPGDAQAKAEKYITDNLVDPSQKFTLKDFVKENDIYKFKVAFEDGSEYDSFITTDGKWLFPKGYDLEEVIETATPADDQSGNANPTSEVTTKSDKPAIELFVMSHCPYGTQIEKGLIPVIERLGDKIDFNLKFCNYSMHGDKELNEELAQYCIQKEQGGKLITYLKCFLDAGDSAKCLGDAGIDKDKLASCVSATDKEYKVTEQNQNKQNWKGNFPPFDVFAADNTKYGVQGSPTLIINGQEVSSGRDSQSLLNTVCSAFNTKPDECNQAIDATAPSAGFGYTASTGGAASASGGCANQ